MSTTVVSASMTFSSRSTPLMASMMACTALAPVSYTHLDVYKRQAQVGYVVMLVLVLSGILGEALGFVTNGAFAILGSGAEAVLRALGAL